MYNLHTRVSLLNLIAFFHVPNQGTYLEVAATVTQGVQGIASYVTSSSQPGSFESVLELKYNFSISYRNTVDILVV